MSVKNFYVPREVTDFASPLSKHVERSIRQNEEDLKNKLEHSAQVEKADPGVANLQLVKGTLSTLASLSQTAAAMSKGSDIKEQKKQTETNQKLKLIAHDPQSKEAIKKYLEYRVKEDGALRPQKDLNTFLASLDASPAVKNYIREASTGELIRAAKYTGTQYVNLSSIKDYRADILKGTDQEQQNYYKKIGHSSALVKSDYIDKTIAKLKALGLSDDIIAATVINEVHQQAETLGTSAAIVYDIEKLTDRNITFQKNIDSTVLESETDPNAWSKLIQDTLDSIVKPGLDGKLDYEAGKLQLESMLAMGISTTHLTHDELRMIRQGLLRNPIPAGKHGKDLLSEKQFDNLGKLIDARNTQIINASKVQRNQSLASAIAECSKGNCDPKKLQQARQNYLSAGGLETDSDYKIAENLNPVSQEPSFYKSEKVKIDEILKTGRVPKLEELGIQSNKLSDEVEVTLKKYNFNRKKIGMDKDNSDIWATKETKNIAGDTLDANTPVRPGSQQHVRNRISKLRDEIAWDLFQQDKLTEANLANAYKAKVTELGRYVKPDGFDDPNYGPLTPTVAGEFPANDAEFLGYAEEVLEGGSAPQITVSELAATNALWNNKRELRKFSGRTDKERLMNSGLAVSDEEYAAVYKQLANDDFDLKNFKWPPDLVRKSEVFGVQPSVMIEGKTKSLEQKPNDLKAKSILAAVNPDKVDLSKVKAQVTIRQFLEGKDYRLLSIWENQGPRGWTNNHMLQLMELEGKFNNLGAKREFTDKEKTAQLLEINKKKAKERLEKIRKGIQETEDERRGIYQ